MQVKLATGETFRPEKVVFAAGRAGDTDASASTTWASRRTRAAGRRRRSLPHVCARIYARATSSVPALASVSMEQARVAVCWAFDIPFKRTVDPLPPFGVYAIPEVAMIGMTEEQAVAEGIPCAVGRARFDANTRATIAGSGTAC